ncbi:MAG: Mov34/MPN/PAD-1 family protein [Candidatus Marinimicrobia bacterium]|nr:Mov34/MPN/PAD-1 family protein [Candidatus Neomarinimicrobiota bacterium]
MSKCRIFSKGCGCSANLRQRVTAEMPGDYETAFTICERNKQLARGTTSAGGKYAVTLDVGCPSGFRPIGIWHSHPNGVPQPSNADISEMRKLGLRHLCISVPQTGEMKCHIIK